MKKTRNNLEFSIIFRTFAIVMITIATIGSGSEKPEQAQFSLALHDGCIIEINPIYSHFKNTQHYEEKHYLGSPSEDCYRCSKRSTDSIGNNSMHGTVSIMNDVRLSPHFTLAEFCNSNKYPANVPTIQQTANMAYGCRQLLEPAREAIGCPIIINSGFRNSRVNAQVGGVRNSQHLQGQAADIRPKDPKQFQRLVDFLKGHTLTDQLLTGPGWLHISWAPFGTPRNFVRIGYYK